MSLIPALGRQRQMDLFEFKATLGYVRFIQSKKKKQSQVVVAHIFNPSTWESHTYTWEVGTGRDVARNIRQKETGTQGI